MISKQQILFELYNSRTDTYAIRTVFDGKKSYGPHRDVNGIDLPFTENVCLQHMRGDISIGCYPLDKQDLVKWVAIDFDGKRGDSLKDALIVKAAFEKDLGLICWLEKSQSGNGIHLWIYFTQQLSARIVRGVLGPLIPEFDIPIERRVTSYDRMFPNQDSAFGSYGNLCALPLNGQDLVAKSRTVFIKDDGTAYEKQSELLYEIYNKRNTVETILVKGKALPARAIKKALPVLNEVPGGTKLMAPAGCAWLRDAFKRGPTLSEPEWYAALGQFARVEQGEVLAHRFSEAYPGYSYDETQKKLEHAKAAPEMSCVSIWEKFGDCGKRCGHLGVTRPWELAKVSLTKLNEENKGKIHDAKDLATIARKIIDESILGQRIGFAWGYEWLDDFTELRPRNLVVVAARQGMGKSAIAVDVSVRGAERNVPQYFFSLEMGYEELALRYVARLTEIDHSLIATGKISQTEYKRVEKALEHFKTLPIFIDDSTRDIDRMLDNAGELIYKNGPGVVWIDYLQLVKKKGVESKKEAVDRVVDSYKQMAKILDVPVVSLAQLNRAEETSESIDDLDSWLKDSGDIEQTADVIHYIRGKRGPGLIDRRWRLHKERHRPSGINFRFLFQQEVFKLTGQGFWDGAAQTELTTKDTTNALVFTEEHDANRR